MSLLGRRRRSDPVEEESGVELQPVADDPLSRQLDAFAGLSVGDHGHPPVADPQRQQADVVGRGSLPAA